jgi:hypothetical protein
MKIMMGYKLRRGTSYAYTGKTKSELFGSKQDLRLEQELSRFYMIYLNYYRGYYIRTKEEGYCFYFRPFYGGRMLSGYVDHKAKLLDLSPSSAHETLINPPALYEVDKEYCEQKDNIWAFYKHYKCSTIDDIST